MPKKFDTNPLDPEFPKKVTESQETETEYKLSPETTNFPPAYVTDEKTQRFQAAQYETYFETPNYQPPAVYQANRLIDPNQNIHRKVEKIGLPENVLIALPYLPWGIGLVAGLIELLIVPRTEPKVRFHAAQGMALHIGVWLITAILGFAGIASNWADFGNGLFQIVMMIFSFYWAFKAFKGKPIHIEAVDDLTNWLEEKVRVKK